MTILAILSFVLCIYVGIWLADLGRLSTWVGVLAGLLNLFGLTVLALVVLIRKAIGRA
jgi:hypothetical protein